MGKPRKSSKERKVHAFKDCRGAYYSRPKDVQVTSLVEDVTCGACKQRILQVLLDMDWRCHLTLAHIALLIACKNAVKVDD
jgi:hypothetical protein